MQLNHIHRSDSEKGGILEIVLHKISDNAVAIVNEALNKYTDVSGIILDLRATTGEDEIAAAKLTGLFVGEKLNIMVLLVVWDDEKT